MDGNAPRLRRFVRVARSEEEQIRNRAECGVVLNRLMGRAVPILNSEAVAANSAQISSVGGASLVSTAYMNSLQDALLKSGR